MGDLLLTTEQAAEALALKPGTLRQWRWRRQGPPFVALSRRAVRYRREDIESWLADQVKDPSADEADDVR